MSAEIQRPEVNAVLRWRAVDQAAVGQRQRRADSAATGDRESLTDRCRRQQRARADKKKFSFHLPPSRRNIGSLAIFYSYCSVC